MPPFSAAGSAGPRLIAVVGMLVLLLSGCGWFAGDEVAGTSERGDPTPAATPDDADEADLPEPVSLAIEQRTKRGVTVELTGLEFTATSVEVDATITNASGHSIRISDIGLVDDQDNAYGWVPPEDRSYLPLDDGEVTEGTLSFGPRIAAGVDTFEMEINPDRADRADEGGSATRPYLLFEDIPVAGGAGENG